MSETYRAIDEVEVVGDVGVALLHPEIVGRSDTLDDPIEMAQIYEFPVRARDKIVLNFIEHPKRDIAVSALVLGGLGLAVGAAVVAHHHH